MRSIVVFHDAWYDRGIYLVEMFAQKHFRLPGGGRGLLDHFTDDLQSRFGDKALNFFKHLVLETGLQPYKRRIQRPLPQRGWTTILCRDVVFVVCVQQTIGFPFRCS